jgi:hypothetical protein
MRLFSPDESFLQIIKPLLNHHTVFHFRKKNLSMYV